jgi:peroxiredoxin Q/BCP
MAQLRRDYLKFETTQTQIVVVGPEKVKAFAEYWEGHKLPFIGLPDPKHSVLKLYGQKIKLFKLGRMPAQVIIDKAGVASYVHYGHSMSDIPKNDELLEILEELNNTN